MSAVTERTKRVLLNAALRLLCDPPPHLSTGIRWINRGVLNGRGDRVKLRAEKIGARYYVTLDAIAEFVARMNPDEDPEAEAEVAADAADRRGADADAALRSLGY